MKYLFILISFLWVLESLEAQTIMAYYTKVERGEDWEELSRTTEHPDIIVELDFGQIVFWRGASYLPVWETENDNWPIVELIKRSGDGPSHRPDATNSFSFVRVISRSNEAVLIHWRYLPEFGKGNPKPNVNHLKFVDEYFTIKSDGHVLRTVKQGTTRVDDWLNDSNLISQEFDLTSSGIKNVETITENADDNEERQMVNQISKSVPAIVPPIAHFAFDNGSGDEVLESITDENAAIEGQKSYWKKGVNGSALAFDGYHTKISTPLQNTIGQLSVEAWIAIGAYPFNRAPIIQQNDFGKEGFYFGVGPSGKLTLRLQTDIWNEITTDQELPLRRWTHVAASYDGSKVTLYINGKPVKTAQVQGHFTASTEPLVLGFNTHKQIPGNPVRPDCEECHTPVLFGFDGLMDEVRLYDTALSSAIIQESFQSFNVLETTISNPDLDERILPTGPSSGRFEASYTHLNYYDTWDNLGRFGEHADVVVEFDDLPTKFIFWRGMSYVPQVVNAEKQWYNNQFNESWDAGGSWGEPMSDKQSMRSHVRIIENTPARKVIHWRYAQVQINGTQQNYDTETGWGDWSDWYYYIYPDGVAAKRMVHWSGDNPLEHEWQESIGVMSPGQTPEDISFVYDKTVTFDNLKVAKSYDWGELHPEMMIPEKLERDWERKPLNIQVVNYKSDYKPFTIGEFRGGECYGDFDAEIAPYSQMVVYIHWPLGQLPTDGTRAYHPDRGSSNGYTHLMFKRSHRLGENWAERVMLEGMSSKSTIELRPLARSWLSAPEIEELNGASTASYDKAQRAYVLEGNAESKEISFSIDANQKNPIENLCLVIKNWGKSRIEMKINNQTVDQNGIRTGYETNPGGKIDLVVWLDYSSEESTTFLIEAVD